MGYEDIKFYFNNVIRARQEERFFKFLKFTSNNFDTTLKKW